jgi:hypothetical protein
MQQLELKLFWPLQEQLALDLDYQELPATINWTNLTVATGSFFVASSNISDGVFAINTDEVVFRTKRKQSLFQRLFFRLLGLRVENVDN